MMGDAFDLGVLSIEDGKLHLDIPKLLAYCELPDTEENRDLAVKTCIKVMRELRPDQTMFVVLSPGSGNQRREEVD